jgi:hypothetical protein
LLPVVFDEFQRAVAAARRYEHLKRADAAALACDGISAADIPRRIFEEFYAIDDGRRCRAPSHIETWGSMIDQPQDGRRSAAGCRARSTTSPAPTGPPSANGIAWNLLNMSIAFWLLLGRLRPRAVPA